MADDFMLDKAVEHGDEILYKSSDESCPISDIWVKKSWFGDGPTDRLRVIIECGFGPEVKSDE